MTQFAEQLNDSRARSSAVVVRALVTGIQEGVYVPGQPLPSARELSRKLSVDRGTVARAMKSLESEGLIRRTSRMTHIVSATAPMAASAAASRNGLLADAIAVLTIRETSLLGHRRPGWVEYITLGAMQAIQGSGHSAIAVHPSKLDEAGLADLAAGAPLGVVLTDLLTESGEDAILRGLRKASVPLVVCGDAAAWRDYDRVSSDQEAGCHDLTAWLVSRGHRRILPLWHGLSRHYWLPQRLRGYRRAMREAGLVPLEPVEGPRSPQRCDAAAAFQAGARFLAGYLIEHLRGETPVDAILTASDGEVAFVSAACRLFGKTPGSDVAVAGYDHYWADCPERRFEPSPPAASVDKRNSTIGAELVALLIDRTEGRLDDGPQLRTVAPKLITDAGAEDR